MIKKKYPASVGKHTRLNSPINLKVLCLKQKKKIHYASNSITAIGLGKDPSPLHDRISHYTPLRSYKSAPAFNATVALQFYGTFFGN